MLTDDIRLPDPRASVRALPKSCLVIVRARDNRRRTQLAMSLRKIARARGLILLIADDPLLAARIGAQGIHLPEARAREALHWRARFPRWFITVAAHSLRAINKSAAADAVLLSPVFATLSHKGTAPLTAVRARLMARQARVPLVALGGIDASNAALLRGFAGIAAIGALTSY